MWWPGVRCGERIGAERRHRDHPELHGEVADGAGEAVPRHVRLGSGEQQHVVAGFVAAHA